MMLTLVQQAYQAIMYCRNPRPESYDEDYVTLPVAVLIAGQPAVAYGFCNSSRDNESKLVVYKPRVVATWRIPDGSVGWMPADGYVAGLQLGPERELVNRNPAVASSASFKVRRADYGASLSDLLTDVGLARRVVGGANPASPMADRIRHSFDRSAEVALLPFYRALAPQYLAWLRR